MKKALVTGAAGFIASHLVDDLLADGWDVTGVDNLDPFYNPEDKLRNLCAAMQKHSFRLIETDICDFKALKSKLSGDYEVVVHLAAKAGVRPSIVDPIAYQETNVCGTQNLLELVRAWECRQFVFGSSSSVYGVNPNVPWREEDKVLMPISPYASTKVSGELLGHVYSHLFGIRFIALRFFTVYGPRQRPDLAIHKFASLMQAGRAIPVYGDGSTRRDYTFVSDIVAGIRAAMSYEASAYEIFNLGNNQAVGLMDLIEALSEVLAITPQLQHLQTQAGDVPQTWACIDKAQRILNYTPRTSLRQGLESFAKWLKETERAKDAVAAVA